ncbi:MAG: ribosome recycling factor [Patescibacteria group bacterium]
MDLSDVSPRMEKALEIIRAEISTIRTGRASPSLVENIVCSVYGGSQNLKVVELGMISASTPGAITIKPWDVSIIGEIRSGIQAANVGLTPIIDGEIIRIQIPPLSQERRQEFIKLLNLQLENGRVMIRQIRHDKMIDIKRAFEEKELNEDEKFRLEQDLQKLTDEFVEKIDEMGEKKEKELLTV